VIIRKEGPFGEKRPTKGHIFHRVDIEWAHTGLPQRVGGINISSSVRGGGTSYAQVDWRTCLGLQP